MTEKEAIMGIMQAKTHEEAEELLNSYLGEKNNDLKLRIETAEEWMTDIKDLLGCLGAGK